MTFLQVSFNRSPVAIEGTASFPLALAVEGERVRVVELSGGEGMSRRLDAMGLRPGSEFEVLQRNGGSGMVVRVAASRLALGVGMLHRIRVCKTS